MIIRFRSRAGIYNAGEVAGFNRPHELKVARDYVARGVADEVEADPDNEGRWVPVGATPEPEPPESATGDLEKLTKAELVALAAEREVQVTRDDGQDGEPRKADYIRALSVAADTEPGPDAAAADDDANDG